MKTFSDNAGRTWCIEINVASIKQVKATLAVDLLDVLGGELIEKMSNNPVLLCDVLYVLCQEQADKQSISDIQFGAAMAGDAINAATSAFLEEMADFFPAGKRQVLHKAIAKLKAVEAKIVELANNKLDDPSLDQQIVEALQVAKSGE